jgi:hypothetical protein
VNLIRPWALERGINAPEGMPLQRWIIDAYYNEARSSEQDAFGYTGQRTFSDDGLAKVSIPLRDGALAVLWLPPRLTKQDAARLTRFVNGLAMPDEMLAGSASR